MSKTIKLKVETGYVSDVYKDELEVPEGWDEMSEEKQEEYLDKVALKFVRELCSISAWVEEG